MFVNGDAWKLRYHCTLLTCPVSALALPCFNLHTPLSQAARGLGCVHDSDGPTAKANFEFPLACGLHHPHESHSYVPGCFEKAASLNGRNQLWFFRLPRSQYLGNTGGAVVLWKCFNKMLQQSLEAYFILQDLVFERHVPFGISIGKDSSNTL